MRDGDIDYSECSLLELEEALATINKQLYPKNYSNLLFAYEQLKAEIVTTALPETSAKNDESRDLYWARFWISRLVYAAFGVFCFWWAYDVFTQSNSCSPESKLIGLVINTICESFGSVAAAGIPFVMGLLLVAMALHPIRRSGP